MKPTITIEEVLEDVKNEIKKVIDSAYAKNQIIISTNENRTHWDIKRIEKNVKSANKAFELFVELFPGKEKTVDFFEGEILSFFEDGNLLEADLRIQLIKHHKVNLSGIKIKKFSELYDFDTRFEEIISQLKELKVMKIEFDIFDSNAKSFIIPDSVIKSIEIKNTTYLKTKQEFDDFVDIYMLKEIVNDLKRFENFSINPLRIALPSHLRERLKNGSDPRWPTLELDWEKMKGDYKVSGAGIVVELLS